MVYAAAIRHALGWDDLRRMKDFTSLARVIIMKDPSSLTESILPADVNVPFLLLSSDDLRELVDWYGRFIFLRLELKGWRDRRALIAIEVIRADGPQSFNVVNQLLAEFGQIDGVWHFTREGRGLESE